MYCTFDTTGLQIFYDKQPHRLFWTSSRAACGQTTLSVIPHCLNYDEIVMLYTKFTNVIADRIIQPGGPHAVREPEVGNPCSTSSKAVYIALLQGTRVKCSAQHYTNVKKRNSLQLTSVKCKAHHCKIAHAELYYSLQASDIRHSISKCNIQGLLRPAGVRYKALYIQMLHTELYYSLQASDIRHNIFKCYIQGFTKACRRQI
jgi:hypothetical protein